MISSLPPTLERIDLSFFFVGGDVPVAPFYVEFLVT